MLYIKPTDVPGARFVAVRAVSPDETVDDLYMRWARQEQVQVRASQAHLFLVARSAPGELPTAEQEAEATPLENPSEKLHQVNGLRSGSWLLVRFDSTGARARVACARVTCYSCLTPARRLYAARVRCKAAALGS